MTRAQHTPGPWFATTCTFDKKTWKELHGEEFTVVKEAPHDAVLFASNVVALVWADDDEEKATARLISAAPELLEALEILMLDVVAMSDRFQHGITPASLDNCRTAIAKARGQS